MRMQSEEFCLSDRRHFNNTAVPKQSGSSSEAFADLKDFFKSYCCGTLQDMGLGRGILFLTGKY